MSTGSFEVRRASTLTLVWTDTFASRAQAELVQRIDPTRGDHLPSDTAHDQRGCGGV